MVIFGSFNQIDDILKQFKSEDVITITKSPRRITRRIFNSPFIEPITLPPYISSANNLLKNKEEIIFTLGYFASLATTDYYAFINLIENKVLISEEENDEYGAKNILIAFLYKHGYKDIYYFDKEIKNTPFNNIELRYLNNINDIDKDLIKRLTRDTAYTLFDIDSYAKECSISTISRLQQLFGYISLNDSLPIILEQTGLKKFIDDNKNYIDAVNLGHYIPSLFDEIKEDNTLSPAERCSRVLTSRQAITSQFVQTVISVSADIIRSAYK